MTTERPMNVDEALRIIQAAGYQPRLQAAFAYLHMLEAAERFERVEVDILVNIQSQLEREYTDPDSIGAIAARRLKTLLVRHNALSPDAPKETRA